MSAAALSSHRIVQVFVPSLAIEDGATPPPAVGAIGEYPLVFSEPLSGGVLGAQTFRVRVEPFGAGIPRRGRNWDGTYKADPPRWPLEVHGDGWTAMWRSRRPVLGHVQLEGVLEAELFSLTDAGVRGRITRVQVAGEPLDGPPELLEDRQHWLLTELDPTTLRYRTATLVPEVPQDLGLDDGGTTWILADGVRHCPPGNGATAELYDLPVALTGPGAAAPAAPSWGEQSLSD